MAPTQQEELTYYALRPASLREQERYELWRKMNDWEQRNQIQTVPFGVSGERDSYAFDPKRGYAYKVQDEKGRKPKQPAKDKKKFLWEHDWKGVTFGSVTILRRSKEESRNGAMWIASCGCGHEFPVASGKIRQKLVKCSECGGKQ